MQDGLYLYNTWVAQVEVAITKQANDLSNPTAINSSYANLFTLPDTQAIRSLLENAEQVDAGGRDPYRLIPAKLVDEGEVSIWNATLLSFQGGWKVSLTAPLKGLFEQLADLKLGDLDLSRYDHPWTIPTIISLAGKTEGCIYPAIDYGSIDNGVFAQDTLTPAIYAKSVINAMLQRFGYRAVGDWQSDALYNRLIIPFVEDEPVAHDLDWQQARMARVTVTGTTPIPPFGTFDGMLQFNRDAEPLTGWVDGKQNNFKAESSRYVCDVAMRLHVMAFQQFSLQVDFGAVEAMLIVEKNGQNVAQEYVSHGGPWGSFTFGDVPNVIITLDEHIDCKAGDQIQIRFILRKQTTFAQFTHIGFINEANTWAFFQPDVAIKAGDTWLVSTNMPDLTCAELLKSIALMMSGTYEVNEVARTIELRTLDAVIANEANVQDLSHCIEESAEPENAVTISPYGQKNLLKWKQQDDKTLLGWGDGVITCGAQNIPLETTLFELPFSAVISSSATLANYGSPPLIKTRAISGSGASVQVSRQAAPPCLLLAEPTRTVVVTVNVVNEDLSVTKTPVPLTGCWWHARPEGVVTVANAFGLGFDKPSSVYSREQTMSQRYFNALRRMLRRPRQLTPSVYFRPVDFATLDLYAPVRLRAVRAGSLDLNDNFYYLSKVNNYVSGRTCTMVLVPY
ncbi:hypothetical protein [Spirosoma radiotolerans]|uniref:Uncharacterized protein n=1 Tax=Spirosoma radiotolerans TaxID=1379870 RepID=A0A0E3ZRX8_9BACT|nr:hypothetical protein [Spirosoma radiotolerans]AKD54023.1 hypothetical protein SD10_03005 [Spirosoma radiotolerans]